MTEAESAQIPVERNRTGRDDPRDQCIHELFEAQVERTPKAIAVRYASHHLTYGELDQRASQLAGHLREIGVGPDIQVGLCVERSLEMLVAMLGILKAGGAYVPLDPDLPPGRLAMILEDAAPPVLMTQRSLAGLTAGFSGTRFFFDEWKAPEYGAPDKVRVSPTNAAYLIYTSGSTGRPKGVVIEHKSVANLFHWMRTQVGLCPADVLLAASSMAFDISVLEFFLPLSAGACVVIVPGQLRADGPALANLLNESNATVFQATPSMWKLLVQAGWRGNKKLKALSGGDTLSPDLARQILERCGELWNLYGPTETTIYSLATRLGPEDPITIGRPIDQTTAYVLDPDGGQTPIGVPGELWIGGDGLAREYFKQPALTAERFIRDPFTSSRDARIYRTGDLVRCRTDGNFEFLGRLDSQVKIRGFRVELGEIESVLHGHSQIVSCAVIAQDAGEGDKVLVTYVVEREGGTAPVRSLRQWLLGKLPDYMIPSRFVAVPVLPLNPNGKLDREALIKSGGVELGTGSDYVAARTQREHDLVGIWQSVLGRQHVGVQDNFFDLGGHSLLAIVLCQRIGSLMHVEVPFRLLLEHPTIEGLLKQLESSGGDLQNAADIEKADRQKPLVPSFAQRQMWFLQQISADKATYNEPVAWHLTGRVDREKVRRALQTILERHDVLRTALVQQELNLVQQIASAQEVRLPWQTVDLHTVPPGQRQAVLEDLISEEAHRPFDLAHGPLWRATWIELGNNERVLACTFHHCIVDEWSMRLFFQELAAIYASDGSIQPAGLPDLPIQYADYAAWQRQPPTGDQLEQQRRYWEKQLKDVEPNLELPADAARPLQASGRGATHYFQIPGPVAHRFRALARAERTTLFTVVLAAFQVWLHRYTGRIDFTVGTPVTNRERSETQALLGCFLNTLPLRARLEGSHSFTEVIRHGRKTVLGALRHANLPFEQIVELFGKERQPGQQPLYQVMFVLVEEGLAPLHLDQAEGRLIPIKIRTSKTDLILDILAEGESLDCKLEYATDLFSANRASRMARHLTELFRSVAENPERPIGQLNLMSKAERHQILVEWTRTEREYPRDQCVHELFEQQAERTPEAVAVVCEGRSWCYRELNTRANRLSHHLRLLGTGRNDLVGLQVERSFEMIIGMLAILKARAAFWALETNLPDERLRLMIADAQPRVLLVQRKSARLLPNQTAVDKQSGIPTIAVIEDLLESTPNGTISAGLSSQSHDAAYVNYTSGSTGQPKGVVVPHRGVVRLVKGADYASLTAEETFLNLSPLAFDASTFELWGALLNGGRVVLMPPGPPTLLEIGAAIRQHQVTTLWLTAGLFHLMVDERLDDLKTLRQLLTGGDVLSPEHVRKARRALPDCRIINGYGPTENTTFTTCHAVEDGREFTPGVPIGRPIANTQVYILDEARQPVPVGVPGELYAGGDGLACGYLHQPQLTAERFIPHPFSTRADARLYRTGDRARWKPDGNVEFLGRLDSQVKIRGFRVELGEVEAALRLQPEISDVSALVREKPSGDKELIAYLISKTGERPDASTLRLRLAERLPDYMLPNAFVWLDRMPLSPNGKVDRKALPEPKQNDATARLETSEPVNLLELRLISIWRRLFQREDIDRHDNFFDLGGHSLLAARLAAEIDKLLGCNLPIAVLFQSPTIESLSRKLTGEDRAPAWSSLVPLQAQGSKPPLFFVHNTKGDVYHVVDLARLLGPDQPSYGIQAVGLDGKSARHRSVEEMAAHYVREIVSFQPDGPYYLVGYSLGGIIAFEMARQLQRLGRRVALLALLDTTPVGGAPWFFRGLAVATYLPGRCLIHLKRWRTLPPREWLNYFRGRWARLRELIVEENRSQPTPASSKALQEFRLPGWDVPIEYYHAIALPYRLRYYPGSVDVFVSCETFFGWRWYWQYLTRGAASFYQVPGRHLEILSGENLPVLAKLLCTVLQGKQADATKAN